MPHPHRTLTTLGLLIVAGLSAPSLAVEVLLNPGFELGTDGDADEWAEFGGPTGVARRSDSMPKSGGFHLFLEVDHINNTPAAVPYFAQQIQPVGSIDNSLNYDLSFSAKVRTLDFTGIDMFYQIQWLDQDGSNGGGVKGEALVPLIPAGISTTYQTFGLNDINVPDGADSFLLRFQLSPGPIPGIANAMFIDDASLKVHGAIGDSADFNGDGAVNLLDLDILGANFGGAGGPSTGDANSDGLVDLLDLDILGANFGSPSAVAVPEPVGAAIVASVLGALVGVRRRR